MIYTTVKTINESMEKYVAELLQLQTYFMHNVCNCAIYLSKTHNLTSDILLCNGR